MPNQIEAGSSLDIVGHFMDLNESSLATIRLYNGTISPGEWFVVALDDVLNVSLSGDGKPDRPLRIVLRREVEMTLRNASSEFLS